MMVVIKKIEGLGELKVNIGQERGFLGFDSGLDRQIKRASQNQQFPQAVALGG